jgi:hypothetical protein
MAILTSNNTITTGVGNSLNIPGGIQFVNNTGTITASATDSAWVSLFSTSITTTKAGNKILVEFQCLHNVGYQVGNWNIALYKIAVNGTDYIYSGYNGTLTYNYGFYEKTFVYTTSTQGTYTFVASGIGFNGGTANFGSTVGSNQYLRLYEIGT